MARPQRGWAWLLAQEDVPSSPKALDARSGIRKCSRIPIKRRVGERAALAEATMMKFPRFIEALQQAQSSAWAVGDILVAECGPPSVNGRRDGSRERIREAYDEAVKILGSCEYSVEALAKMRCIAYAFPTRRRHAKLAWSAHETAGCPEILEKIVAAHPGEKITRVLLRTSIQTQRREQEATWQKVKENMTKAREAYGRAEAVFSQTQTEQQRTIAGRERVAAAQQVNAARRALLTTPPPKGSRKKPVDSHPRQISHDADEAIRCMNNALDKLKYGHELTPADIAALTVKFQDVARAGQQAITLLRAPKQAAVWDVDSDGRLSPCTPKRATQ
jgi:hypothetical protein